MAKKAIGGGSSAVAASSHAACARFRGTDPLVTGRSRRALAKDVGHQDDFGGIPEARWMRAMTFERLVYDKAFASELVTTAVGRLGLDRPSGVVIADARDDIEGTAEVLALAHERAIARGEATMLHRVAVPFAGFEDDRATDVKPDFAIVAPRLSAKGGTPDSSWLIVGDSKDYERVRSRIDDGRLLKGFLQVALGAESAAVWSRLPDATAVHPHGVLAVPRNAFLQPEALVELLDDHRSEVRLRIAQRREETSAATYDGESTPIEDYVRHLKATFDPAACASCTLFSFCRAELRGSSDPTDLLIEISIPEPLRPQLVGLVTGTGVNLEAAASLEARIRATVDGVGQLTGQARVDQACRPGTVNVVIAKADSAALGVYGIATQVVTSDGAADWRFRVFDDPQDQKTRRAIMKQLGEDLTAAMKDRRSANEEEPGPVHLVVPDRATADLLASMADNLAGVELSRIRWQRDKEEGRTPLTFNGETAKVPRRLSETARVAVSFLLEEDRARAFALRSPIVDVRSTLARHLIAGGPEMNALRLDYLVPWANSSADSAIDHRELSDEIEAEEHTPGARLTNRRSDAIHAAFVGTDRDRGRPAKRARYESLVHHELGYKTQILDEALAALDRYPDSKLREVHRAVEGDAQAVWRRRLEFHASDLVRFGRTYRNWRNSLVEVIEADAKCEAQLLALTNPQATLDSARDAGTRDVATARVVDLDPLTLEIDSRRIGDESRIVLLHINGSACVESANVDVKFQKGSFKLSGMSIGPLEAVDEEGRLFEWMPANAPNLSIGDELVVANFLWFGNLAGNGHLPIKRPPADDYSAPGTDCEPDSFTDDPDGHKYCCRTHEIAESEWSDILAERRANGELNPDTWPPVVDTDGFEVSPEGAPTGNATDRPAEAAPENLTADDLD